MRNFYHIVIGFAIAYLIAIIFGFNIKNYPITLELWNNAFEPFLLGFFTFLVGFFWEKWQEKKFNAKFDINDAYRTGLGGVFGAITGLFFVSWWLAISMVLVSGYLVVFHYKK